MNPIDFEFYETPDAFSNWLFDVVDIRGRVFEPCVGNGAIVKARWPPNGVRWFTNDLDPRWPADVHKDATVQCGPGMPDFGQAIDMPAPQFIRYAPESVIDQLDRETPAYRARMDLLMADRAAEPVA